MFVGRNFDDRSKKEMKFKKKFKFFSFLYKNDFIIEKLVWWVQIYDNDKFFLLYYKTLHNTMIL